MRIQMIFSKLTMRELFCQADKNMYIDKKQAKINEATEKRDLILRVIQQLKDKGIIFRIVFIVMPKSMHILLYGLAIPFS